MTANKLKISQDSDEIQISMNGTCIIKGIGSNGNYKLKFSQKSGIAGELSFKGNITPGEFLFEACGNVKVCKLQLFNAIVQVSPSGVKIHSRIRWSNKNIPVLFNMYRTQNKWTGIAEFSELLKCAVIQPEKLQIRLNIEDSGLYRQNVRIVVNCRLTGFKTEIKFAEKYNEITKTSISALRQKLLELLINEIVKKLYVTEIQYPYADSYDYLIHLFTTPYTNLKPDNNLSEFFAIPHSSGKFRGTFDKQVNMPNSKEMIVSGFGHELVSGYINQQKSANISPSLISGLQHYRATHPQPDLYKNTLSGYLPSEGKSVVYKPSPPVNPLPSQQPSDSILRLPGSGYINFGIMDSSSSMSLKQQITNDKVDNYVDNSIMGSREIEMRQDNFRKIAFNILWYKDILRAIEKLLENKQ